MNDTFHGAPVTEWIGRMVKSFGKSNKGGKVSLRARHGHAAKCVGFGPGTITIVPVGHGQEETMPREFAGPWWSRNPDLKPQQAAPQFRKKTAKKRPTAPVVAKMEPAVAIAPKRPARPAKPKPEPFTLPQWGHVRETMLLSLLKRIVAGPDEDVFPAMAEAREVIAAYQEGTPAEIRK